MFAIARNWNGNARRIGENIPAFFYLTSSQNLPINSTNITRYSAPKKIKSTDSVSQLLRLFVGITSPSATLYRESLTLKVSRAYNHILLDDFYQKSGRNEARSLHNIKVNETSHDIALSFTTYVVVFCCVSIDKNDADTDKQKTKTIDSLLCGLMFG